jgi:kumamolisin
VFALPTWQASAKVPAASKRGGGRGVPDVCGDADPTTGYAIRVDGENTVIGGTSAVAPLWAGLIAVANQQLGTQVGLIQPAIYAAKAAKAFNDITVGNNGGFSAGPGWDACTGLGSPIASKLIPLLALAGAGKAAAKKPAKTVKKAVKKTAKKAGKTKPVAKKAPKKKPVAKKAAIRRRR